MDFYTKELLINQILSGKLLYKNLILDKPNIDIKYQASKIYIESIKEAEDSGLLSKEECEFLSIRKGYLTQSEYDSLEVIEADIVNLQKELYINRNSSDHVAKIKSYLKVAREEYDRISNLLSKFESYSCEGYAAFSKVLFIVSKITKLNDSLYDFSSINIDEVVKYYISNIIFPSTIRDLSRDFPWVNKWQALKANGVVFPNGYEITDSQQLLLMWSKFYDSISESAEEVEDFVIQDNDMLDGWLTIQRENKNSKKKDKDGPVSQNSKILNAQEVYIVANNLDELKAIENMNSSSSKSVRKQRFKKIMKDGTVNHMDLPDIKNEYIIQANSALKDHYGKQFGKK